MADKTKVYQIKVPIYTSNNIPNEHKLFGDTYVEMLESAKLSIEKYNNDPQWHVTSDKRAKTNIMGINQIKAIDCSIGSDKCLLLRATVYKTNLIDGYYEGENSDIIIFKENDKLCSNTHFLLLYPNIFFNEDNTSTVYWRVFVYEDPSKSNDEVTRVAKLIMKEIIKCPIRCIKEKKLMADLKAQHIINGIEMTLTSLVDNDDDTPPYLQEYIVDCHMKKVKKIKLENIPSDNAIKTYFDTDFCHTYTKRQIQYLLANKRVLTVTQEFKENLKQTFEDSFNYSFEITEQELKNGDIFKTNFIVQHME